MRHTTRLMSLGVMAAFCLTLAAADDKPATAEQKETAKERASAIELIIEAEKLESMGKDYKAPTLYVTAGAMYVLARSLDKKFEAIKDGPEEAKPGEKAEPDVSLAERAELAFTQARKLSGDSAPIAALIKQAQDKKLLSLTRGNLSGPYRQSRTLPARSKHTFKFTFQGGQMALVGFAANGAHLKFHVKHPRLGQVGMIYERGGTWREMAGGRLPIDVTIENPHDRPVTYTVYTN